MNKAANFIFLSSLLCSTAHAADLGLSIGLHDMVVANIQDTPFNGGDSHTFGGNIGAFVDHTTSTGIVLKGDAVIFADLDRDHLDPDHIPVWWTIHAYANGPIVTFNDHLTFQWLLQLANKQNTVSGIEREQKQEYGLGLDYTDKHHFHLAAHFYGGFFYRELDDDAPAKYGYERRDLGYGSSIMSLKLEGSYTFAETFTLGGHLQSWKSLGIGSSVVESEAVLNTYVNLDSMRKNSTLNLDVTYTKYNMDVYYRPDLGVPAVPWDNDTLVRLYMTIPWSI